MNFAKAIIFGVLITIVLILVSRIIGPLFKVDIPAECSKWNDKHAMEITTFIGGIVTYLVAELFNLV